MLNSCKCGGNRKQQNFKLSVIVLGAIMRARRPVTATTLATLLCAITYAHGVVDPNLGFISHAFSNPSNFASKASESSCHTMEMLQRTRSGFQARSLLPSQTRSPWSTQRSNNSRRRVASAESVMATAQQTAPSSPGFWARPGKQEVSVLQLPRLQHPDVAVVWFTACDLRTHDHDALVASAGAAGVVPLYVFDDQELAAESRLDAAFAFHAVQDLRKTLRAIGSDLVVRSGSCAEEVKNIVAQAGASHVFFHDSPVHALRQSHERVRRSLSSGHSGADEDHPATVADLRSWSAAQLTGTEQKDASKAWNFHDFEQSFQEEQARAAFPQPSSLPPIPDKIEAGPFPSLEEVLSRVGSRDGRVQEALSVAALDEAPFGALDLCVEGYGESRALRILDDYLSMSDVDFARNVFGPEEGEITAGVGPEQMGLEAVTTRRIVKARGYGGLAPGEALARALGVALALGCISPRRLNLARQPDYKPSVPPRPGQEQGSPWGFLRGRLPKKCWAQELAVIESWHSLLAERDVTVGNSEATAMEQRYLRWHGWLVRYAIGGSQDPSAPAVLLVHGFGASADQWDRVFEEFAPSSTSSAEGTNTIERGKGVKLLALDLVGFGHSAKPPLSFSQYSWADCARDVALRAGGGPFFIAGNSIGGYISMGVAADCKELCQGVVLVNSAGRILTDEEFQTEATVKYDGLSVEDATRGGKLEAYSAPPNVALTVLGSGLFAFLQGRIAATCRNVYPVNPGIVDEGLAENILRDSCDPGAVGVIAAGGKLPFSRSANEMLGKFGGPVLVTQGVKDPLNDAEGRATLFQELGPQVDVVRVDGGHCPHHEVATEVCNAVSDFVEKVEAERPLLKQPA